MKPSQDCIDLVKEFEGFSETAYQCPAGVWTIGYGTTTGVTSGYTVTEQEAEELLMEDLTESSKAVEELVDIPLTQEQYDALVSFVYNVGREAFRQSTLLRLLNANNIAAAALQFSRWNKSNGKVLPGLTRRRLAERQLFET